MLHRNTRMEIETSSILHNIKVYENLSQKEVFAVVKANAYGLGILEISKLAENYNENSYLCCATFDEALYLRKNNIKAPILVMGYTKLEDCDLALKENITITVPSLSYAKMIQTKDLKVHLKINTSMNRLGHDTLEEVRESLDYLKDFLNVEGIYTHYFSSKFENLERDFLSFRSIVEALNYTFKYIHASSSNSALVLQEQFTNAIRIGIGLYGGITGYALKTVATLKTEVVSIRRIKKGESVSYNGIYTASKDTLIATLPIGYADGVLRSDHNNKVYINDQLYPIVGNICMDQMMIEIDDSVNMFDEVEIFGEHIDISKIAHNRNTINYEVLTCISLRVTRIYK